jgi:hypothetical protein
MDRDEMILYKVKYYLWRKKHAYEEGHELPNYARGEYDLMIWVWAIGWRSPW